MATQFSGAIAATSQGTAVTSGGGGSKGAYTELSASTDRESFLINARIRPTSQDYEGVLHLATGSAASEVDFMDLPFHGNVNDGNTLEFFFTIASGVRLSMAMTSTDAAATANVTVALTDDDSKGTCVQATLIGSSGGKGAVVDAGATINTKGAWVELDASIPHDFDYVMVNVGYNNNNAISPLHDFLIDIGTGASSSEVVAVSDIVHRHNTGETNGTWYPISFPFTSGMRLSARAQSSGNTGGDRVVDISIVGFNITAPSGGGGVQSSSGFFC